MPISILEDLDRCVRLQLFGIPTSSPTRKIRIFLEEKKFHLKCNARCECLLWVDTIEKVSKMKLWN
jgi:hypothetical protein